ncbi:multidrug effflux MFS transporter [Myroides pelagicus]|uniref:Bcr/CflA family efflux MFS transporter n=1 Tax=Myroides pelagicus TaxID=270914 RepID=A0A7K1GSL8_9FLAO|nr:multidrug effflux MFS transporter [Myroides pelagicus]MEC4112901.1 multidrug effflux MFS transporter [Myroides pelagicus]MTH30854.1 Bcr/CflA family efflux MFS transporter [Myroides pelagicus]
MEKLTSQEWILIFTLVSLTALGPLAIDMYLPAFPKIAKDLNTEINNVQISLSTFLGGLAIGQLFWGPISDKYGSKKPILISMSIFIISSFACIYVQEIKVMWLYRFLQAFGSSGGLVIARAIVNKRFDKDQTLKIFSILALIGGIAPIVAPVLGDMVLTYFDWQHVFTTMALFATLSIIMTTVFLKEDTQTRVSSLKFRTIIGNYLRLFESKVFITYTIIGSLAFSCLMLYISNAPLLVMEKGGLTSTAFSFVFMINSCGLMIGSFLTSSILRKRMDPKNIIKLGTTIQILSAAVLLLLIELNISIYLQLVPLFTFVLPLGMLFPTSTTLALSPFKLESGTASALFGASQLAFTFLTSLLLNSLNDGSMSIVAIALVACAVISLIVNQTTYPKK